MILRRIALPLLAALAVCAPALRTLAADLDAPGRRVEELLELARAQNPAWQAAHFETEAARERVQPAGALPDPMFKVELMDLTNGGSTGPQIAPANVGSTQYTLSQQIPFWGKRDLRRAQAEAEARSSALSADDLWLDLAAQIKRTYAQYWQVRQLQTQTQEIGDLLARMEDIARTRYASGLAAQQDVIRAQVERTSLQQDLVQLDSDERGARTALNGLLARRFDAPLADPTLRALPAPAALQMDALADRMSARNPAVAAEAQRVAAAENARDLAYRNRYPDLNVGITPVQRGSRFNEWQLMFEVNIPLQQTSRRSQEHEAEAMLDAARARVAVARTRLVADLGIAVSAADAARQTEALTERTLLPQSEATFDAALAGYETGRVDFATLLEAQRSIRKARQDLIRARTEQQVRLADIERIVGDEL